LGTCFRVGTSPETREPQQTGAFSVSGPWRNRTSNLGIKSCPFAGLLR
jgi:hypothetical protein